MATMTVSRPAISSPLADSSANNMPMAQRVMAKKPTPSFPSSRALRPFASISHVMHPPKSTSLSSQSKTIKLIQPPKNFKATFVLDLTQAEFSRQD